MKGKIPSIHEAFNARSLSTEELCNTFIISDHYSKLASSTNTIMIGPRGSGKTTLMRMLQVQSLEAWQHKQSTDFRKSIKFSGVFIPTDRVWKTQFDKICKKFEFKNEILVVQASFTYHVLERFISTIEYLTSRTVKKLNNFRSVVLDKASESELVIELANLFKVVPRINSLKSLEIAITSKKSEISSYLSRRLSVSDFHEPQPKIIVGEIGTILGNAVAIANLYFGDREHKWAFLFDELELAPENIVQPLVDAMRGGPDNIILKLSLSPYHKNVSITSLPESSMKDQDLSFISLTATPDKSGYTFSKELCGNIFSKYGLGVKPVDRYFDEPKPIDEKREFSELIEKDPTFANYLKLQKIDIDRLENYTEKDKRPTIRKVKFVVQIRNYYRKLNGKKSRKSPPPLYAGFKNICKSLEYNPRMLIGITNKFLPLASNETPIPVHEQLKCLSELSDSFKALLNTIPIDSSTPDINTIYDLVEKVAQFFQNQISGDIFRAEPKGSLIFVRQDNTSLIEAIGFALNAGAMIAENGVSIDSQQVVDIKKIRCRLSYLFAHKFGLLMSTQREVDLGDIIFPLPPSSQTEDLFVD
ncbi:hypothetical protein TDB9533_03343 [Thalassocella blandensis]|nr:hypothetical protein TDB9533_03343 [Thalassocella blandensis]